MILCVMFYIKKFSKLFCKNSFNLGGFLYEYWETKTEGYGQWFRGKGHWFTGKIGIGWKNKLMN